MGTKKCLVNDAEGILKTALPTVKESGNQTAEHRFFENKIASNEIEHAVSDEEEWLTPVEVAKYLRLSLGSVRNMTSNGELPYFKLGRRVRYLKKELRILLFQKRGFFNGN